MNFLKKLFKPKNTSHKKEFGGYCTEAEKDAWARAMVGAEFVVEKRFDDALTIAEQGLAKAPNCKEAWFVKATALSFMRRPTEALTCLNKALEIDPHYQDALTLKRTFQDDWNN